eukprot:TRINITY_DN2837_c0_g1_i1.p1 TRINITY_DN2837_c0_g1~~TRINITY_DN2837_c0_g1_i1.p1  ORF type:complete len:231 (-),score=-18.89 TRINITY_DN2837_c0_g1_i1:3-695(-)
MDVNTCKFGFIIVQTGTICKLLENTQKLLLLYILQVIQQLLIIYVIIIYIYILLLLLQLFRDHMLQIYCGFIIQIVKAGNFYILFIFLQNNVVIQYQYQKSLVKIQFQFRLIILFHKITYIVLYNFYFVYGNIYIYISLLRLKQIRYSILTQFFGQYFQINMQIITMCLFITYITTYSLFGGFDLVWAQKFDPDPINLSILFTLVYSSYHQAAHGRFAPTPCQASALPIV